MRILVHRNFETLELLRQKKLIYDLYAYLRQKKYLIRVNFHKPK